MENDCKHLMEVQILQADHPLAQKVRSESLDNDHVFLLPSAQLQGVRGLFCKISTFLRIILTDRDKHQ